MSTSKLQRYTSSMLSLHFGQYIIRENIRPNWLIMPDGTRLELDFYIEEILTAIEVQGEQHFIYTPHFHGNYDGFKDRLDKDQFKRDHCACRGINLIEVSSEQDVKDFIFSHQGIENVDLIKVYSENTEKLQALYQEYIEKRKLRRQLIKTYNRHRDMGIKSGIHKHLMRTTKRLKEIKQVLRVVIGEDALR